MQHLLLINFFVSNNFKTHASHLAEVRSIEEETHKHTAEGTSDRDRHDPGGDEQADTLPVDSLVSAVAEADADGSTGDAHGGRNGEGELRENQDSDSCAHFHAAAARWGVVGDLVTHDYKLFLVLSFVCAY